MGKQKEDGRCLTTATVMITLSVNRLDMRLKWTRKAWLCGSHGCFGSVLGSQVQWGCVCLTCKIGMLGKMKRREVWADMRCGFW